MKSKWNGINEYYSLKVFPNYSGSYIQKKASAYADAFFNTFLRKNYATTTFTALGPFFPSATS